MEKPWIMNGKEIVEKLRDPTQLLFRLAELVAEANIKCPKCQCCIDCSDVPMLWSKLPIGFKFDPSDWELLQHLEEKINQTDLKSGVLINEFIPTIEEPEGICYTHPENLPGIKMDGSSRHFFHRISNAYGCGHRKRRKIDNNGHTVSDDKKVRWHKTGRSKEIYDENGVKRGWKKILVLYKGSKKGGGKTDKAGWVMHQYHLGVDEAEKNGQLVVSKISYQLASKKIDKPGMDVSVLGHDASAVKVDPRTPKTDPPQPHRPINSPCETEQHVSPFLLDQAEAESSASKFHVKDENEYPVWCPLLSQIFEDTVQPEVNEPSVTVMQAFVSESGSGSGAQTFLDKGKATVSSMQVLEPDAGPSSRFGKRSWESSVQVTPDEPTRCRSLEIGLQEPMHDGLPDYNTDTHTQFGSSDNLEALLESFFRFDADGS